MVDEIDEQLREKGLYEFTALEPVFVYARCGELVICKLFGLAVYQRIGDLKIIFGICFGGNGG